MPASTAIMLLPLVMMRATQLLALALMLPTQPKIGFKVVLRMICATLSSQIAKAMARSTTTPLACRVWCGALVPRISLQSLCRGLLMRLLMATLSAVVARIIPLIPLTQSSPLLALELIVRSASVTMRMLLLLLRRHTALTLRPALESAAITAISSVISRSLPALGPTNNGTQRRIA